MNRKNNDLEILKEWCDTVLVYLIDISKEDMASIHRQTLEATRKAFNCDLTRSQKMKSFKILKRELSEDINEFRSETQKKELSLLLVSRNLDPLLDLEKMASDILERQKILNDDEFRFLNSYINVFIENEASNKIDSANNILLAYEEKRRLFPSDED